MTSEQHLAYENVKKLLEQESSESSDYECKSNGTESNSVTANDCFEDLYCNSEDESEPKKQSSKAAKKASEGQQPKSKLDEAKQAEKNVVANKPLSDELCTGDDSDKLMNMFREFLEQKKRSRSEENRGELPMEAKLKTREAPMKNTVAQAVEKIAAKQSVGPMRVGKNQPEVKIADKDKSKGKAVVQPPIDFSSKFIGK